MAALEKIPSKEELSAMIGESAAAAWARACAEIDALYDMERTWGSGGKKWTYEYKYRRGGKTLCALYAAPGRSGIMLIFGVSEREKLEPLRPLLSPATLTAYDEAETYYDGKWVMFPVDTPPADLRALLSVKRRPNRK